MDEIEKLRENICEKLRAARDECRTTQLASYWRAAGWASYEEASLLELDVLEKRVEEDDWRAWESFDGEDVEHWERDEGCVEALDLAEAIVRGEQV